MSSPLGVCVEANVLRAAMRERGNTTVAEIPWNALHPNAAVEELRVRFPSASAVCLAIGLAHIEIAKPDLPPLAAKDKRRVLMRDADRYFPVEGEVAVGGQFDKGITFATSADQLHQWVRAFEEWVPVRCIVAAPVAIAAGLSVVNRATRDGTRSLFVDAGIGEIGWLQITGGVVNDVRRCPPEFRATLPNDAELLKDIYLPGANGAYAAPLGALAFRDARSEEMLLDSRLETTLNARRSRRAWLSVGMAAIALIAMGFAADARREKTLLVTQAAVDSLTMLAPPGRASQQRLADLERETQLLQHAEQINDPLNVLADLSTLLPRDAFVDRLSWDGNEWRIDGSTDRAAAIVPGLDSAAVFSDVRVLTASTRFRDGSRMRESFSVAFKLKGAKLASR